MVFGCASTETIESTKVSPTEIYQAYSINSNKNSTNTTATFRVGGATGSTVDLDVPSKILHNEQEMSESKPFLFKGTDYNASAKQFVSQHKFSFTDAAGKTWNNEISLDALEITSQNLTISKANGGIIVLSRPVGKDENVEFSIVSEKIPPSGEISANSNAPSRIPEKDYSTNFTSVRLKKFLQL